MIDKDILIVTGISVVFIALLLGLAYALEAISCRQKWADSGFDSQYSFFSGCRIYVEDKWIPDNRYRAVEP